MASTVQVERGQFRLVGTWIMKNGAAIMFDTQTLLFDRLVLSMVGEYSGDQGS
jgi:hypothetical protein